MTRTIPCPFLIARLDAACIADPAGYRPSVFEVEGYCTNARHVICPLYCTFGGGRYPAEPADAVCRRGEHS